MRFVDDGVVELDAPIVTYLPSVRLPTAGSAQEITVRHLLTHTSGIDGDVFTDTGQNDDCLRRYIDEMHRVPVLYEPGETWGYCSSGFQLLGCLVEMLTGWSWDRALRDLILDPLGTTDTVTRADEAILRRAAAGHLHYPDEDPRPTSVWGLPRSMGPSGGIAATASDVLTFASAHLAGGVPLISADSGRVTMAEHARLPDPYTGGDSRGLGWMRSGANSSLIIGHDGGAVGQFSYLRLVPDADLAIVLLTNGGAAADLYQSVVGALIRELAGAEFPPAAPGPAAEPADIGPHLGTYSRADQTIEVMDRNTGPLLRISASQFPASAGDLVEMPMTPYDDRTFLVSTRRRSAPLTATFYRSRSGTKSIFFVQRSTPRSSAA